MLYFYVFFSWVNTSFDAMISKLFSGLLLPLWLVIIVLIQNVLVSKRMKAMTNTSYTNIPIIQNGYQLLKTVPNTCWAQRWVELSETAGHSFPCHDHLVCSQVNTCWVPPVGGDMPTGVCKVLMTLYISLPCQLVL